MNKINHKNNKLVTVYIVNKNYGSFLDKSIKSVLSQSYKKIEVIIIDDGSIDNSHEIISKYEKNENIKIVKQKSKGLIKSINIAINLAKGEFIIRLDSDDYFERNAIIEFMKKFQESSKTNLVYCNYHLVDIEGNYIDTVDSSINISKSLKDRPAHGACMMIRTNILKEIGGYDERYNCQDGYYIWLALLSKGGFEHINKPLFSYRQHSMSLSKNETKINNTQAKILRDFVKSRNNKENSIIAIIPIREKLFGGSSNELNKLGNKPLLFWTIDAALRCKQVTKVVLACSTKILKDKIYKRYKNKVSIYIRDKKSASLNTDLGPLVFTILKRYERYYSFKYDQICILNYQYPFKNAEHISKASDMLSIFKLDSVIGVRSDNRLILTFNKGQLNPLSEYSIPRLERNSQLIKSGGLNIVSRKFLVKNKKILGGLMSTINFDKKSSHQIEDEFDMLLAHKILEIKK